MTGMSNRKIAWIAALLIAIAALIVIETWIEKRRRWTTGIEGIDDPNQLGYTGEDDPAR